MAYGYGYEVGRLRTACEYGGSIHGGNINEASEDDKIHKIKANIPHRTFNINGTYPY